MTTLRLRLVWERAQGGFCPHVRRTAKDGRLRGPTTFRRAGMSDPTSTRSPPAEPNMPLFYMPRTNPITRPFWFSGQVIQRRFGPTGGAKTMEPRGY